MRKCLNCKKEIIQEAYEYPEYCSNHCRIEYLEKLYQNAIDAAKNYAKAPEEKKEEYLIALNEAINDYGRAVNWDILIYGKLIEEVEEIKQGQGQGISP